MKIGVLATTLAVLMITGFSFTAAAGPAGDSDGDGTYDVLDICSSDNQTPSPIACDTDVDGYGNHCDADFDNSGLVNLSDFSSFAAVYNTTGAPGTIEQDMDCNGAVNLTDFSLFASKYNQPPGPSGLSCAGTPNCQ